jgi:tetratricopeptide (TPR) repeat protein
MSALEPACEVAAVTQVELWAAKYNELVFGSRAIRRAVPALALTIVAGRPAATGQRASSPDASPPLLEIVRRPTTLREDIGRSHEAVATSVARAQAFYDQGLAYLHSYVWLEAARSFTEALRADSDLAMAHLGLSYALGELGLADEARAESRTAQRLAAGASEREKVRIDIRARQLEAADQPVNGAAQSASAKALEDALARFPADVELLLLVGQAQDPPLASHGIAHESRSLPFYQKALDQSKDDFAVHHYLAHAYENMNRVDLALPHAERYAHEASGIPHAHHMLGHVLRRVDRIEDAIAEFVRADEIETAYLRRETIPAEYDWHYRHNLNLLGMAYRYAGRMNAAAIPLRRAFELDAAVPPADDLTRQEWPAFLLSQGRAGESLAAARALVAKSSPLLRALGHLLASRALQAQERHDDAAEEGNLALQQIRAAGPPGGILVPEFQLTRGEFLLRSGDTDGGRAMVHEGVEKLRAQSGPDAWAQTLFSLESAARTARELGDWQLASELADDMRRHDGSYAGTEYALGQVAEHKGDRRAAAAHFQAAVRKWGKADPDLPALRDARRRASASMPPR